ncbi:MAG: hypothetical protein WC227_02690 [Patescibacteria group bacterium]|jgi:hypothetical protein
MDNINANNTELRFQSIKELEGNERLLALIVNQIMAMNEWIEEIHKFEAEAKVETVHTKRVAETPGAHTLDHGRVVAHASKIEESAKKDLRGYHARLNKLKRALATNLAHLFRDLSAEGDAEQARVRIQGFLQSISDEKARVDMAEHRYPNEIEKLSIYNALAKRVEESRKPKVVELEAKVAEAAPNLTPASVEPPAVVEDPVIPPPVVAEESVKVGDTPPAGATPFVDDEPVEDKISQIEKMGSIYELTTKQLAPYYPGEIEKAA